MTQRYISILLLAAILSGCAGIATDETADWTAEQFYQEAKSALDDGNYESAVDWYGKLEARYPYGRFAEQAQMETAYAYYKSGDTEAAVAAAERFIKLHPRHGHVDYAYYLRGLATFEPGRSLLEYLSPQDPAKRDPSLARRSFNYFKELIDRFPDSEYNKDAVQRMTELRNTLARHEVGVADFYLRRGAFLAAVNRAKYVVENYQKTPSIPDAMVVMVRGYRGMGMADLAADTLRVLKENFPEHPDLIKLLVEKQ